jgi:hypothetical protein
MIDCLPINSHIIFPLYLDYDALRPFSQLLLVEHGKMGEYKINKISLYKRYKLQLVNEFTGNYELATGVIKPSLVN